MKWFGRGKRAAPDASPAGLPDRASIDDVRLAYRLILKRDPDAEGLKHYRGRIASGLTLDDIVRELMASDERADRVSRAATNSSRPGDAPSIVELPESDLIDPDDVMRRYSVEELNRTSDEYYSRIDDPTPLMLKPFAFLHETPEMLENLGMVLGGLHLGKTMRVLDFGAGTCWLSRILTQLNCEVICCDPSPAALEIGRRLYDEYPPAGPGIVPPQFLVFDGHRLDLPDASIDRIVCFDAFHHVPNQAEVLAEFARVLRPGGIVGFSEPGPRHSRSPQAQYEMRNHRVLENDIRLDEIYRRASAAGFTDVSVRVLADALIPLDAYNAIVGDGDDWSVKDDAWRAVRQTMGNRTLFFLRKGQMRWDSRTHVGLAHHMETSTPDIVVGDDLSVRVVVHITNRGEAHWLHRNTQIYGIVRLASHLYDENGTLLEVDHSRHDLPHAVAPGESLTMEVEVPIPEFRAMRLDFDLVSEGVRWFENEGSRPVSVNVRRV